MKVLVTGADGLLGNNLIRELLKRNYNVTAFIFEGSDSRTMDSLSINKVYGNILKISDLLHATLWYFS